MSQYNNLDRDREVRAALTGHDGENVSVIVDTVTLTGTLDLSQLSSGLVGITAGTTAWTVSTFNISAVGIG